MHLPNVLKNIREKFNENSHQHITIEDCQENLLQRNLSQEKIDDNDQAETILNRYFYKNNILRIVIKERLNGSIVVIDKYDHQGRFNHQIKYDRRGKKVKDVHKDLKK